MANTRPDLRTVLRVDPGSRVDLGAIDPSETHGYDKQTAADIAAGDVQRLAAIQDVIWAEHRHRILIVLQGIDASGKDGAIRHVLTAFNPLGCRAVGFGIPTPPELAHDYLWRIHAQVPGNGEIVVFNRSHYESVLVERVQDLVPASTWSGRYDQINAFERLLVDEGTTILKFFLHIDEAEQLARFRARLADPTKRWKFNPGDLADRKRWPDYQAAFEDALTRCSTDVAPWYVIPANRKWFRDLAVAAIVAGTLEDLRPTYPLRPDLPAPSEIG